MAKPSEARRPHLADRKNAFFSSANATALALQALMQNPIKFQPATKRTREDEERLTARVRPRLYKEQQVLASESKVHGASSKKPRLGQADQLIPQLRCSAAWSPRHSECKGSHGFPNIHVLCYRNSTLQALLHAPKIVNWLRSHAQDCKMGSACIAVILDDLSRKYWSPKTSNRDIAGSVAKVKEHLKGTKEFARWRWGRQQDANEFYLYLINAIIEKDKSTEVVMKKLFGHVIARTTTCTECRYESKVSSPYEYRIGVALERANRIEDLLRLHTFAQVDINGYRCDKCRQLSRARQKSVLHDPPDILEIEFLRFKQEGFGRYIKNSKAVAFDQTLRLRPFTDDENDCRYSLFAVVQHIGTFQGGHYRCVAKSPSGNWEILDDELVRVAPVAAALRPKDGWTPYTLYYARVESSKEQ